MSYAIPISQSEADQIEQSRLACKARHDARDESARADYERIMGDLLGPCVAGRYFAGMAHFQVYPDYRFSCGPNERINRATADL